jgi:glutamyl-tRNA synthetase
MAAVRVRFSPAPTGSLHVGSAHTALFNWLFARHRDGTFVLRIEDTDGARNRAEHVDQIIDTLQWLGLDWDEGPILQSTRRAAYQRGVDVLLAQGEAYECFETPDELDAINVERKGKGLPPGYDGRARDLTEAQREALRAEGRPVTIRFRTPEAGESTFRDIVRGDVSVAWSTVSDFVIVRSDGNPLFFLANAVDDLEMGITHVIRGEDLLDSTHRVLAIRRALGGAAPPEYAHLPLLVGADRAKLSKRHGAVSLDEFRDEGYLPEALVNYLALLGWAPEDGREVLSRDELIAEFQLERVTHAAGFFDHQKLDWMNGEHLRARSLDDLAPRARPFAVARHGDRLDEDTFRGALAIGQERATTLVALVDAMDFLFVADNVFEIEPAAWERVESTDRADELFDAVIAHVETCAWEVEALDLRPLLAALQLKPRQALPAVYAAIEGRAAGLPLFDSIFLLGRERSLARLQSARGRLG